MEFRVLGSVEFLVDGRTVPIGHPRQRSVLAVLLAEANRPVLVEQLIDRVWGEDPPTNVRNVLSGYVTRLRGVINSALGGAEVTLSRRSGGYALDVDPARVDLHRFRDLVARARTVEDIEAAELLAEALELWRGPAFADASGSWLNNLRETLDQERMTALLRRNDIALQHGQHADLLAELHELAASHPLDERVTRQLMLALYRCGRQADALAVYAEARSRFVDELGLDPGQELRALESRILSSDPALALSAPATPASAARRPVAVPRQLPAGTADFTGRDRELAELDETVGREHEIGAPAVVISAIDGTAGVGKTALAVHWGRRMANRFPDGQLFVNLRGQVPGRPLEPLHALTQFLRALGVPPEQVPLQLDEAAAMYRTVLADRRVLVLLDDAYGPEQVRPLLPGSPACTVLITSRNRLSGLVAKDGARRLMVDLLSTDAAHELLARIIGEQRVSAEPEAVAELVGLCAYLPLALRIAAANLANFPRRRIADYVTELRRGNRLDALEVEGDQDAAVRTAFNLSYAGLGADARKLFRRLGLVPGPDFTAPVAAALVGCPPEEAAGQLKALSAGHLVDADDDGRYRFHDLLRLFARDRVDSEESDQDRSAALARLYGFYLHSVGNAAAVLYPQMLRLPTAPGPTVPAEEFVEHNLALSWLDTERANLLAVIADCADGGPGPMAWLLADSLRGYFWRRRCAAEWLAAARNALRAAEADGDRLAQSATLLSIGDVHWSVSSLPNASDSYRRAFELAEQTGWTAGQASILGNLASVDVERGELDRAEENYLKALDIYTRTGRRSAQGVALSNLGNVYWELGRLRPAAEHFTEALRLHEEIGALVPKANSLLNLGCVHHDLGRLPLALATLTSALGLCREIGDSSDEATALDAIARVYRDLDRPDEAAEQAHAALDLSREIGARRIEAGALTTIGSIHQHAGRSDDAIAHHQQALALGQATGDPRAEAESLVGIAGVELDLGRFDRALRHADDALARSRRAGYRLLTGRILTVLARIHHQRGDPDIAIDLAEQALGIQCEAGDLLWEARTRRLLGLVLARRGEPAAADTHRQRATALFTDLGVTES